MVVVVVVMGGDLELPHLPKLPKLCQACTCDCPLLHNFGRDHPSRAERACVQPLIPAPTIFTDADHTAHIYIYVHTYY